MRRKKKRTPLSCEACYATCCRYLATEIDTPTCKRDYDNIRWYLMHQNVHVFVDHDNDWYIEFESVCSNLTENARCQKYEDRPRICAKHGEDDGTCEFHSDESPYDRRFSTAREFEEYLAERGIEWRWGGQTLSEKKSNMSR